jgi:hypothetical protein
MPFAAVVHAGRACVRLFCMRRMLCEVRGAVGVGWGAGEGVKWWLGVGGAVCC